MEIIVINKAEDNWGNKDYQGNIELVINAAVNYLNSQDKFNNAVVSVVLADDQFVAGLNKSYRGQDKPTNILSFAEVSDINDWDEELEDNGLGDLILSFDTIMRESKEQNKIFDHHFSHLLVHGFLHLLGYDHIDENDAEVMESIEVDILHQLKIDNPYKVDGLIL